MSYFQVEGSPKEKETYGPGVKDYFWLACRFVESIAKADTNPDAVSWIYLTLCSPSGFIKYTWNSSFYMKGAIG